jgi:hypothetical protein
MAGVLIDTALTGSDGDVTVFVQVGEEHGSAVCRWLPDLGTLDVLEASSPAVEAFVHADHEVQDEVEQLHSRFVAEHRAWFRGGWVAEIEA